MEQFELCPNGEDVKALSAMAATGNFDPLLNGKVSPDYMRPKAQEVAIWLLEQELNNRGNWPPSFQAMTIQFPDLGWDRRMMNVKGLVVESFVGRFIDQARSYQSQVCALAMMEAGRPGLKAEEKERRDHVWNREAAAFRRIGEINAGSGRLGEDADQLYDKLLGLNREATRVETPWTEVNKKIKNWYRGIYAFFGKAKEGKTHVLIQIAVHIGLVQKLPVLYVDMENDPEIIMGRMACAYAKINHDYFESIKNKLKLRQQLSATELKVLRVVAETTSYIHKHGQIYLMTQDDLDEEKSCFGTGEVCRRAQEIDAEAVCMDQLHKFIVEGRTRPSSKLPSKTHAAAETMATKKWATFVTTQQNRTEGRKGHREFEEHFPDENSVFGGQGVSHNCLSLWHVRTMPMAVGVKYEDRFNIPREARYLQCLWPVVGRNGGDYGIDHRVWLRLDNYSFCESIPNMEGSELMTQELQRKQEEYNYNRGRGGKGGGGRKGNSIPMGGPSDYYQQGGG